MGARISMAQAKALGLTTAKGPARAKGMNSFERWYADQLTAMVMAKEIAEWRYEAVTLRLAERTRYEPDFVVWRFDFQVEFIEVKGPFVREDSRVKFKACSAAFPMFRFRWVQLRKQRGVIEVVNEELWKAGRTIQ